ncbi:MAG: TIGR03668 family PPOX class F420-dependent oxidoreductase [Thaumarchaeota archaeon]|nr:TIGR03668 family PPOX class F420-dependent oxidoreductase [Nitrososphaerota archaeon]
MKLNQKTKTLIKSSKVARLATVDQKSCPYVVPVVFVFHENSFFIPLDEKVKTVNARKLKRVKNIEKNPNVTLLIDKYQNDWKKLFFLMIHGKATVIDGKNSKLMDKIHKLLISKYPQYKKTGIGNSCITINPTKVTFWNNS